jgi:archaemetzincin
MKVGILQFGQVAPEVLAGIQEGLTKTFPDITCTIITEPLPIPQSAFDKKRGQYSSSILLNEVDAFAAKTKVFQRVLGVVDVDVYASGLNYVFGEAYTPGKAALISLWRLKPEFCKDQANPAVYGQRVVKEAVHEVGHTLGVKHCQRSMCVMHFSNSIFDTDKKQTLLCDDCYLKAAIAITNLG